MNGVFYGVGIDPGDPGGGGSRRALYRKRNGEYCFGYCRDTGRGGQNHHTTGLMAVLKVCRAVNLRI